MKTFCKVFIVIAMILVICACPEESNTGGSKVVNVGTVTITIGGTAVTTYTINVGEEVTLEASASGATSYTLQSVAGGTATVSTAGLKITGLTAGTVTIRCNAANTKGGGAYADLALTVLPKLTEFDIYHFQTLVPENETTVVEVGYNEEFNIQITPLSAQKKFEWSFSPATGVEVTEQSGKWILKAAAAGEYEVTVAPAQAGLTASEKTGLTKTFTLKFELMSPSPVTSFKILDSTGDEVTSAAVNRGYSKTFRASHTVPFVETSWSTSNENIASVEFNGPVVVVTATDADAGGTAIITASASNRWNNSVPATETLIITVPEKGDVIFEWKAEDNPTEGNLVNETVRNYPGFRDVWITSRGGNTHYNRHEVEGFANGAPGSFIGARVGSSTALNGSTANPRFVIGAAVISVGDQVTGPLLTGDTTTSSTNVGTLDLSKPVRLTLGFADYNFSSWFRIYVNNNGGTAGNSNIGEASQIKHYNPAGTTFIAASNMNVRSGVYQCIIDFSNDDMYRGHQGGQGSWTAWAGLNSTQKAQLEKAFIALTVAGSQTEHWINLTHIKLEYITVAYFNINQEADFAGFPDTITTDALTINLTGAGITTAKWYVNGKYTGTEKDGKSYTLDPSAHGLIAGGQYSLTAVVTVGEHVYSKTAYFTVAAQ